MMGSRRPIASRETGWAKRTARWLVNRSITPNQISQMSVVFAAFACVAFWLTVFAGPVLSGVLLLLAALACQGRLLCNLFDGMVAVEGGKSEADGPFWNEAPDRVADFLILAGLGLASQSVVIGLLSAALAITTAYIRELGRAEGLGSDFSGPFAKPQRMAAVTLGCVVGSVEAFGFGTNYVLSVTLWVVLIGTGVTVFLRSRNLINALETRDKETKAEEPRQDAEERQPDLD